MYDCRKKANLHYFSKVSNNFIVLKKIILTTMM